MPQPIFTYTYIHASADDMVDNFNSTNETCKKVLEFSSPSKHLKNAE